MRLSDVIKVREEDVQQTIIQGLTAFGYTVLQTSNRGVRHQCSRCGNTASVYGSYGATKGVPDLIVTRHSWPNGCALLMEVKGPQTRISPDQQNLVAEGRIVIVRSWEDAQRELFEFVKRIKGAV